MKEYKKPTELSPSKACATLIEKWEGRKLKAYVCPAGILTIGMGHTGRDVTPGKVITDAEADALLKKDMGLAAVSVRTLVKVPLTQGQFDALVSFVFNLGGGRLRDSTLLKKLNAKDYTGAHAEFDKWVYSGKTKLQGLVNRRNDEQVMYLS